MLDSIDDAIERTEEVIATTEALRDSLLHELLIRGVPGWHTEWKEVPVLGPIPADWEVVRLGDVAEVKGGKRLPKGSGFASENTALPYIRVVDFDQRTVSTRNLQYVTRDVQNLIRRYTINSTDLYISIAGTIGLVGTVPEVLNGANLTENAAKITMKGSTILTQGFAVAFLSGLAGQSQIASRINKLGQPKLALERIKTIGVPLPQLDEQRKIVGLLNRVDRSIDQARMGLKALRSVKTSSADALLAASAPVGLNRLT